MKLARLFLNRGALVAWTAGVLVSCTGCFAILPSGFLSGFVLEPDATCADLAARLALGTFPSVGSPAEANLQFEYFSVQSANGQTLSGWFIPAQLDGALEPAPLGTVLIMHGTSGPISCTLPWALAAVNNRMHAVVFDYQGYGQSTGEADIATQLDDADAVLNWIVADPADARQKVHLLGVSLGTGPALGLPALRSRPQLQTVALDGAFDAETMVVAIESQVNSIFPLFGVSARLAFTWLFEARSRLGEVMIPAMFLTAELDNVTPPSGAQALYALVGSPQKSSWLFGGLNHVQPLFYLEKQYVSLLVTFWRDPSMAPSPDAADSDPTIHVPSFSL